MESTADTSIKLCECGCGKQPPIAKKASLRRGWVKGQPIRFVRNHHTKKHHEVVHEGPRPLCACGCGTPTELSRINDLTRGARKGQPLRFIHGHTNRNRPLRPLADLFWEKVKITSSPEDCWLWSASSPRGGYGRFTTNRASHRKAYAAHRLAYILTHGEIADGLLVCHRCDNPPCCNPSHLFLGTAEDNAHDRDAKGRTARGDRSGMKQHPQSVLRGSQQHQAKLTESDIPIIRRRRAAGETYSSIASDYGVTIAAIYGVVAGKRWTHVK